MPNIREVQAPANLGLQPTEIGVEATAAAARRGGAFFNQAAQAVDTLGQRVGSAIRDAGNVAVKHFDHQQIATGAARGAQMFDSLTQEKDNVIKGIDPNAPDYGQQVDAAVKGWRENSLEPRLQQFQEVFTTEASQAWAQHYVGQTREHMFHSTAADISTASGIGVKNAIHTFTNSASATAMRDPSSLDALLANADHAVDGLVGSSALTGTAAATVRTEVLQKSKEAIVKAAAQGHIEKTAEMPAWIEDPKYSKFINAPELKQFQKYAESQKKANLYYEKAAEQYQHTQDVRASQAASSQTWTDNVSFDENGKPTIKPQFFKEIMENEKKYPGANTEHNKAMINWAQLQQRERREVIHTDQDVKQDLLNRMFVTDNETTEAQLMEARVRGKLSDHDFSGMHGLLKTLQETPLKEPIVHQTLDGVKHLLGTDPIGAGKYTSFVQDFVPQYLAAKKAGNLPPNALDIKDDKSMISQAMAPYKRTPYQIMIDKASHGLLTNADGNPISPDAIPKPGAPKYPTVPAREKLEPGKTYTTTRGPAKWDGEKFVPVKP